MTEDEMVGWHHQFDGHESEQALGVGDGHGCLGCCSPRGCKESDMTEQLNLIAFRRVSGTQSVLSSEYLSLVAQSCLTLCDPMDCSTPSFSAHHQLLELSHTHVHQVGDAIQPSHLLSSPSPLAFNLSQHQGLFQ